MKKRLLAAILMLAMATSLVACGGNAGSGDTEKDNTQQESTKPSESEKESESEEVSDGKIEYTVRVVDANGNTVAGKMVQVCNASTCFAPVATDANGLATFRLEESDEYKAKLMTDSDDAYVYFESGSTELILTIAE